MSSHEMQVPARLGRPVDLTKDSAILDAARAAFLNQPYERVSMDNIAKRAGVSKVTIYAKYKSKEGVFIAAMDEACIQLQEQIGVHDHANETLETMLLGLGNGFMQMILAPEVAAMHKVMVRAADKQPSLPRQFFQTTVYPMLDTLAAALEASAAHGQIQCEDPKKSATQFIAMVQGIFRYEMEMGLSSGYDQSKVPEYVASCVALFLRGHQAVTPSAS